MKSFLKKSSLLIALVCCFFLIVSCASSSKKSGSYENDKFYQQNIKDFSEYTLDNGIHVIVKQADNNIRSIQITVAGGNSDISADKAGIEDVTLSMLCHGSKDYGYNDIQQLCYETQSSIFIQSGMDYSCYSLNCLDKYFDKMMPVFIDGFLNPTFSEKEFDNVLKEELQSMQATLNDPFSLMRYTVQTAVYKGQPYGTSSIITEESYPNITIENTKEHYNKLINASRLSIIAVGDYNTEELVNTLNKAFGSIPSSKWQEPVVSKPDFSTKSIIKTHESAAGTGYFARVTTFPRKDDNDYYAASVAAEIYNSILYSVVREKYGALYSIGNIYGSSFSPLNIEYCYMVSNCEIIPKALEEAQSIMQKGMTIDSRNAETGEFVTVPVDQVLDGIKNTLINSIFMSSQTNASIMSLITSSDVNGDDYAWYLKVASRINDVTPEQVNKAFTKYWLSEENSCWVFVTGADDVKKIDTQLYR